MNKAFAFFVVLLLPIAAQAEEAAQAAAPVIPSWPLKNGPWFIALAILFLLVYGMTYGMLRDRKPYDGLAGLPDRAIPFSLSRLQMTLWTLVIIGSYLYLAYATGDLNLAVKDQALALMGIVGGTSLGAAIVDASTSDGDAIDKAFVVAKEAQDGLTKAKENGDKAAIDNAQEIFKRAQEQLKNLAPKSAHILKDLLYDVNGVSLHRVQMLSWTLVSLLMFIASVVTKREMPELNGSLVALMGLSNGVYLGFKIPEKQAKEQ
ncbi:MAG: hypothetical protein HZA67_07025 [Rhodospirillales bacterium]|nr:hypothetical protein [Rhodospirillales bacterium]